MVLNDAEKRFLADVIFIDHHKVFNTLDYEIVLELKCTDFSETMVEISSNKGGIFLFTIQCSMP